MAEKEKRGMLSRLTDAARPSLAPEFHIEINDARELIAEGCMGILLCSEEQIKLSVGRRILLVTGSDLVISGMFGQNICIRGRLSSFEFI